MTRGAQAAGGLALLGLGLWLLWPAPRGGALSTERLPLSPQECRTECQTRQTDCILDCDGHVSCEQGCVRGGDACVERCRKLQDAGAPTAAPAPRR